MEHTGEERQDDSKFDLIPNKEEESPLLYCDIEQRHSFPTFNLEKAICSHGLFMMAPNQWDPHTKSLLRPLRLSSSSSAVVRISSSFDAAAVLIRVYGKRRLSAEEEEAVVEQVKRMLRLSDPEECKVREFHELHPQAKQMGFGRVFRSPTLFEDMVKAILFCHCQWPRTLSMAKALCDLQLELQSHPSKVSEEAVEGAKLEVTSNGLESFTPRTPAVKESKRKRTIQKVLSEEIIDAANEPISDSSVLANGIQHRENSLIKSVSIKDENVDVPANQDLCIDESPGDGRLLDSALTMGNFPSPVELASLNEIYLAKRCGLGYRAGRILKLAQGVIEGRIQLDQLEEFCIEASLSNYNKVDDKLKEINGYGPFTRGNVLMCLGFYNVVPTDSETIRHLKQVHQRTITVTKAQEVVEEIYIKYEPYQFLAYWWEIWSFYEGHFGKLSEMAPTDYKLITASNMRAKKRRR